MQLLGWKQPGFLLSHSIPGSISDLHQHPIAASPSKRCVSKIKLFFFEKKKDFNTSDYFWTTWHYIQKSDDRWELLLIKAQNPSHPPPPLTKTKKSFQKAILISENKVLPFFFFFFFKFRKHYYQHCIIQCAVLSSNVTWQARWVTLEHPASQEKVHAVGS